MRVREGGQKKLSDYMLKSAGHVGIVRMPARDSDGSEGLSLKPSVAQSRLTPSAAPFLCTMRPHATRGAPLEFPALGLSHFCVCVSGSMAVVAWSLQFTEDLDVVVGKAHAWLIEMPSAEITHHLEGGRVQHCLLNVGDVLWVPNGRATMWVNRANVACDTAYIPVLCAHRAVRELRADVRRGVCTEGARFVESNSVKSGPWKESLGPALQGWLRML